MSLDFAATVRLVEAGRLPEEVLDCFEGEDLRTPTTRQERELAEQIKLFTWAEEALERLPKLRLLLAIPNGGHRRKAVAGKLKASGTKRGVPDIHLPVARGGFHALWIELKVHGGRATKEQKEWLADLRAEGCRAEIAVGWQAARTLIEEYLTLETIVGVFEADGRNRERMTR